MLVAEPDLRNVLLVGACRESYLLDYANVRSRFMFNFGDGAAAGLLVKDGERNELLGSHGLTDGSLSLQVKVATRRQRAHGRRLSVPRRRGSRGDEGAARRLEPARTSSAPRTGALARSGLERSDVSFLCALHMKRSMHVALCEALGVDPARAEVLDDTGHMSGVDTLLVARPRGARGHAARRRRRAAARGRHGLHVGGERHPLGPARVKAALVTGAAGGIGSARRRAARGGRLVGARRRRRRRRPDDARGEPRRRRRGARALRPAGRGRRERGLPARRAGRGLPRGAVGQARSRCC